MESQTAAQRVVKDLEDACDVDFGKYRPMAVNIITKLLSPAGPQGDTALEQAQEIVDDWFDKDGDETVDDNWLVNRIAAALEARGSQGEYECDGINCPPRAHDHKVLDAQADLISRESMRREYDDSVAAIKARMQADINHFSQLADTYHDMLSAERRTVDELRSAAAIDAHSLAIKCEHGVLLEQECLSCAPEDYVAAQGDLISREAAIRVVQQSFRPAHTYASENADRYYAQDEGQRMVVTKACDAIRNLPAGHPTGECVWKPDDVGVYWTACDNAHQFTDGGPSENKHKYCPYCSKPLVEHPATKESQ